MKLLHQIGERLNPNFNTIEEILACDEPLSFDGVYESVYQYHRLLKGKDITFFISGKYIGGNNSFDVCNGQPLSKFCNITQILDMADFLGARVGYHGWEHKRCVGLSEAELFMELYRTEFDLEDVVSYPLSFAWPYGDYDQKAIDMVIHLGYDEAWSATQGDDANQFAKKRTLLNWG